MQPIKQNAVHVNLEFSLLMLINDTEETTVAS